MSPRTRLLAAAFFVLIAGCVPRQPPPAPTPPPARAPAPAPAPLPAPAPVAWEDGEASPGDWTYRDEGGGSSAAFGAGPVFVLRCETSREISLVRAGGAGRALVVRTSYGDRALPAAPAAGGLAARLAASDPLLDQMLFSRGRFAVEAEGTPRLVLPAWPEPARVVEDCRG